GGDDLVTDTEPVLHRHLRVAAAPLGPDQEQPHQGEQRHEDDQVAHVASSGAAWSFASAASLYDRNSPRSIAARAPATRSSTKRRLCRVRSRWPSSSCWLTR